MNYEPHCTELLSCNRYGLRYDCKLSQLSIQGKSIQAAKVSGIVIIALDIIRLFLLGLTYPSLKLYALLHLDLFLRALLYIVLLLAEGYMIKRAKPGRHFWAYAIFCVFFLFIYFYARANATRVAVVADFFLICTLFHLYPLIIGISQTYVAFRRGRANQKEIDEKKKPQKNLQNKHIQQAKPPTDQEFDAWLEDKVGECLTNTIRKIGLQDEVRNYRQLLRVRGYVLLGMKDAKHYGRLYRYRTQRFFLSLRDGNVIRATVRSQPLDDTENLPIFEIPQSNLEATVALLRKSLQSKKA